MLLHHAKSHAYLQVLWCPCHGKNVWQELFSSGKCTLTTLIKKCVCAFTVQVCGTCIPLVIIATVYALSVTDSALFLLQLLPLSLCLPFHFLFFIVSLLQCATKTVDSSLLTLWYACMLLLREVVCLILPNKGLVLRPVQDSDNVLLLFSYIWYGQLPAEHKASELN